LSVDWLTARGIPADPWFDSSSDELFLLRPAREVAERAVTLTIVAATALSQGEFTPLMGREMLGTVGLERRLSPAEEAHFQQPTGKLEIVLGWRIEAAWMLAWTLGWIDDVGDFESASKEVWFYENIYNGDIPALLDAANLRESREIYSALDITTRVHWRVRQNSLQNKPAPASIDPGIVEERHYALNWVTDSSTDWDDVTTDTLVQTRSLPAAEKPAAFACSRSVPRWYPVAGWPGKNIAGRRARSCHRSILSGRRLKVLEMPTTGSVRFRMQPALRRPTR
jgi:hypothetical protein